jgi:hypothetical protein
VGSTGSKSYLFIKPEASSKDEKKVREAFKIDNELTTVG